MYLAKKIAMGCVYWGGLSVAPDQVPSADLDLLTPGIHDVLRGGGVDDVKYRGRSIELGPGHNPGVLDLVESIGRIQLDASGLSVAEYSQRRDEAGLGYPIYTNSFGSFMTGSSTTSKILFGNPRPDVMVSEWQSLPQAWWFLIGRVPPMPLTASLISEVAINPKGRVRAVFKNLAGDTVTIEYEREPLALRKVTYSDPEGEPFAQAFSFGQRGNGVGDVVVHPLAVVFQKFRPGRELATARCWIRLECDGFDSDFPNVPVDTVVRNHNGGTLQQKRTLGALPLEDVESWFLVSEASGDGGQIRSLPNLDTVQFREGENYNDGCLVSSTESQPPIRKRQNQRTRSWGGRILLVAVGCCVLAVGLFYRIRAFRGCPNSMTEKNKVVR